MPGRIQPIIGATHTNILHSPNLLRTVVYLCLQNHLHAYKAIKLLK
jgi:hypothetical protein